MLLEKENYEGTCWQIRDLKGFSEDKGTKILHNCSNIGRKIIQYGINKVQNIFN